MITGRNPQFLIELRQLSQDNHDSSTEPSNGNPLPVRFVDVKNQSELIQALNSFDKAIVIFDCHGKHDSGESIGKLCLAEEDVDIASLRTLAKMPPIVFTCVCDTHALARNNATCGSSFLECGAMAVVATVLPVSSFEASVFAARLLFRIYELVGKLVESKPAAYLRWDMVVSLLQRMMFVTEYSVTVKKYHRGERDWELRVGEKSTSIIHTEGFQWFESFLEILSEETGLPVGKLEELRRSHLPFPEALKYIQMGHPELIIVGPEKIDWSEMESAEQQGD